MIKQIRTKDVTIKMCINTQIGFDKRENQDAYAFDRSKNAFVVSICDGLGSAKLSAIGSKCAANLMVEHQLALNKNPIDFQRKWINSFADKDPLIFNTTVKYIKINKCTVSYGGIGDGMIAFLKGKKFITQTNHGEFSNQTASVLDPYYSDKYMEESFRSLKECVCLICTDGFSEDIDTKDLKTLLKASRESLSNRKKAKEFDEEIQNLLANWPNQTNGDDKTVAFILVRRKKKWAKK